MFEALLVIVLAIVALIVWIVFESCQKEEAAPITERDLDDVIEALEDIQAAIRRIH